MQQDQFIFFLWTCYNHVNFECLWRILDVLMSLTLIEIDLIKTLMSLWSSLVLFWRQSVICIASRGWQYSAPIGWIQIALKKKREEGVHLTPKILEAITFPPSATTETSPFTDKVSLWSCKHLHYTAMVHCVNIKTFSPLVCVFRLCTYRLYFSFGALISLCLRVWEPNG